MGMQGRTRLSILAILSGVLVVSFQDKSAADELLRALDASDHESAPKSKATASTPSETSPILNRNDQSQQQQQFIPLLAPRTMPNVEASQSKNLFHGQLRSRELYEHVNNGTYDMVSRLDSWGSVERIEATPLSLVWNGQLSYRNGTAYTSADDFHHSRLRMYELALNEKLEDGSIGRMGRLLPSELPGMGFVDGVQFQRTAADKLQIGAVGGFRPERRELGLA